MRKEKESGRRGAFLNAREPGITRELEGDEVKVEIHIAIFIFVGGVKGIAASMTAEKLPDKDGHRGKF